VIGLYGVPAAACSLVAAAGFNVVQTYEFESDRPVDARPWIAAARAYLDEAHRHDLRVLLGVPRNWLRGAHAVPVRDAIRGLRDHPALLAWYEDEIAQDGDVRAVERLHTLVAAEDPAHGLILEEGKDLPVLRRMGRVRMFTYYPVTFEARDRGRLATLPQRFPVRHLRSAFWPVLQAYGRDLVRGYPKRNLVAPTAAEMEFTLASATIAGARSAFFYTYTHATRYDAERLRRKEWPYVDVRPLAEVSPSLWASARRCAAQARALFTLLAGAEPVPVPPLERPRTLEAGAWSCAGATVIVLANPRYAPANATLAVRPGTRVERQTDTQWQELEVPGSGSLVVPVAGPGSAVLRVIAPGS